MADIAFLFVLCSGEPVPRVEIRGMIERAPGVGMAIGADRHPDYLYLGRVPRCQTLGMSAGKHDRRKNRQEQQK